jgi:hypothetical protein
VNELPAALRADFELISSKQVEMFGYAKEKKEISDQLFE